MLKNVFDTTVSRELTDRIEKLSATTTPNWGKMNVGQMLAHCNVAYDLVYDSKHEATKAKGFKKIILRTFIKNIVVSEKPFKKNGRTAPIFLVTDEKEFEQEKQKLIGYVNRVQQDGAGFFDGKESHSLGKLSKTEWNNMFYKHLNHHLEQFGV